MARRHRPVTRRRGRQLRLDRRDRLLGLPGRPAEAGQARPDLVAPGGHRRAAAAGPPASSPGAPSRSRSSSTIRSAPLRPIPGTAVRVARSSVATALRSASGVVHGQHRQRQPGADAARGLQQLEDVPLVLAGEAVQGERILPDGERGGDLRPLAEPQPGEGAGRAQHRRARRRRRRSRRRPGRARRPSVQVRDHVHLRRENSHGPGGPARSGRPGGGPGAGAGRPRRGGEPELRAAAPEMADRQPQRVGRVGRPRRVGHPSSRVTMAVICALSARPLRSPRP